MTPQESRMMYAAFNEELQSILEKDAGLKDFFGLLSKGNNIQAGANLAAQGRGVVNAHGMETQLAKGRNFGGSVEDPFVKMRKQKQLAMAAAPTN